MSGLNKPLVRCATGVEYIHHMREMLRTNKSFEGDMVDLFCCRFPCPSSFFSLLREVDTLGRDLDWKVQ